MFPEQGHLESIKFLQILSLGGRALIVDISIESPIKS